MALADGERQHPADVGTFRIDLQAQQANEASQFFASIAGRLDGDKGMKGVGIHPAQSVEALLGTSGVAELLQQLGYRCCVSV